MRRARGETRRRRPPLSSWGRGGTATAVSRVAPCPTLSGSRISPLLAWAKLETAATAGFREAATSCLETGAGDAAGAADAGWEREANFFFTSEGFSDPVA